MPARFSVRLIARLAAVVAALQLAVQPAMAQSILRDAETEALLQEMVDPLAEAAGLGKGNVQIVLVQDNEINAFVAGGQRIYINSGLINAADSANEVQGVMAHEMGHIMGGHVISADQGAKAASSISILSLLLGVAAMAAGAGDAGMGVMMAGQQAAMGKYLAFSRVQESSADAAGVKFLSKAGISGKGSIKFFEKLQGMEFRYGFNPKDEDAFAQTHPMTEDRIANLQHEYEKDPAWNKPNDPALQARFARVKAKLFGYLAEPNDTLRTYPEGDNSIPARYARAYAWHKEAHLDKAMEETDALLKQI